MTQLAPGANAPLPASAEYRLRLSTRTGAADLIVLCVRADGTADGDNGVALWSQPVCAGGAVRIDTGSNTVSVQVGQLPGDVQRLLVVAQADTVPDLSRAGALTAEVTAAGQPAATLVIEAPPALPTVQVAELYRHGGGFKVRCLGDGYADGLRRLLEVHGIDVTDDASTPPAPSAPTPAAAAQPGAAASQAPAWSPPPVAPAPGQTQAPNWSPPTATTAAPAAPAASPIDLEKRRRIDLMKRVEASGSLSLTKKVEAAAISLDKHGLTGQRASVVLVLDVSGSARPLFKDGRYQALVERALAAGLLFDDDGTIETYLFDDRLHEAPPITLHNFRSWADDVRGRRDIWGLTKYAPPIDLIARNVGRGRPLPTYVMFVTDGGNSDRRPAADALLRASGTAVFWQFMAVGREQDFPFLQKLDDLRGREVDNADFLAFENPAAVPDDVFSAAMMKEFPGWISAARRVGILV